MKYLLMITLAISGSFANNNYTYSDEYQIGTNGFIEEIIKSVFDALRNLEDVNISDESLTIFNATIQINSMTLEGLSLLYDDVQFIVEDDTRLKIEAGWKDEDVAKIRLNHNIEIHDAESPLSFLAGPGAINIDIKKSHLSIIAELESNQFTTLALNMVVDKATKIDRFDVGVLQWAERINNVIHNEDILDIVNILGSELIKTLINCLISGNEGDNCSLLGLNILQSLLEVTKRVL